MNELIFQKLKSTVDGVGATTGKQTEKAFNENFDLVKNLFTEVLTALAITVTSSELKQIRVDTTTDPYTLYYSLDDESVDNPNWIKLLQFGFSQLTGSPYDSISLKTVLDSKAPVGSIDSINLQITGINTDIFNINKDISGLRDEDSNLHDEIARLDESDATIKASIQALKANEIAALTAEDNRLQDEIDALELASGQISADLSRVVFTEQGSTLWMRYDPDANELQASTDVGKSWQPVGALSLEWKQLTGNPDESTTLNTFVSARLTDALTNYVQTATFSAHTKDYDNPHKVTANQLGLGSILPRIESLESQSSTLNYANPTSYLKHYADAASGLWILSSGFGRTKLRIEEEAYYTTVYTLTSLEDSFTGEDGLVITISSWESDPEAIPVYYHIDYNIENTDYVDIKFNEELYTYISGGGVLD